jgi:hypothetical protein
VAAVEGDSAPDGTPRFARDQIERYLEKAREPLRRLGRISDATPADIAEARQAQAEALEAVRPAATLFNLAVAARLGEIDSLLVVNDEELAHHPGAGKAAELAEELQELHFPVAFPEVFLRKRPGFDCILGNPPWDKVRFEAQQFWVTRFPGLNAMPAELRDKVMAEHRAADPVGAAEEEREKSRREKLQNLFARSYVHQGKGHFDYAKLFVERAISLLTPRGTLGYVLPRIGLVVGGWEQLRALLLTASDLQVIQARNKAGWLFEDIDHRLMVALCTRVAPSGPEPAVDVWPAVATLDAFRHLREVTPARFTVSELADLSETLVIPWFEGEGALAVFEKMRHHPRLASGEGWITGHSESRWDFSGSGKHRDLARTTPSDGCWRVLMTRHIGAFHILDDVPAQRFIPDPAALCPLQLGVEAVDGSVRLSAGHPTIAYRYATRNDDSRTLIAAALPISGYLPSTGYVHTIRVPEEIPAVEVLALLGYLNTFTCDWWTRRFVDRHMTAPIINNIPLPPWSAEEREAAAALAERIIGLRGAIRLPCKIEVEATIQDGRDQEVALLAELEDLAARAFGLSDNDMQVLLDDFSNSGCPADLRIAILELVNR